MLNDIFDTTFETDLFESLGNFELFSGSDQVNLLDSFSDEQTENEFETEPNQVSFARSKSIQNISKLNAEQEEELLQSVTVPQSLSFPDLFVHDQSEAKIQRKRHYEKAVDEIKLEARSEPLSKQQKITNSSLETHQKNSLKITSNSQTTKKQDLQKKDNLDHKKTNQNQNQNENNSTKTNQYKNKRQNRKKKKILERNRINARKSRQRKKQYVQGLETETKDLRSKNNELVDEVSKLSIENQSLRDEINQLRSLFQGNCKKIFGQTETNSTLVEETQENSETKDRNMILGKQLLYGLAAAVFPMAQQLKK